MASIAQIIPFLIGGALFGSVILFLIYSVLTAETKLAGRASLRAIESYSWKNDEPVASESAFMDRVIAPIFNRFIELGERLTPAGYIESCRQKLIHAGRRGPEELDRFLGFRVLTIGLIPVAGIIVWLLPLSSKNGMMIFGLVALMLAIGPDGQLNNRAGKRQKAIRRALPDFLDLLTISVEAGLGFEQAIDRITEAVPGELTDEFNRMIGEMRAGASRSEALIAMDQRIGVDEVKSFTMSMVQADQFGVSIGRVLRAQADEMRIKRRQLAHEAAQKAPVKMLLPMTFLIFPALFVVVLGPAIFNIAQSL